MNIRSKITWLFSLISGGILIIFALFVIYFFSLFREQEFESLLYDKALTTAELLFEVEDFDHSILKTLDKLNLTTLNHEEVMIFDVQNQVHYDSGDEHITFDDKFLNKIRKKQKLYQRKGDRESVGIVFRHNDQNYLVVVSAIDVTGFNKLYNLKIILAVGGSIYMLLVVFLGRYFSNKVLMPISQVVEEVDTITALNLNKRVQEGNGKDEIAKLGITFNLMLERLENSFKMQRNFVSNASHEMRTPLTSLKGEIEVTLMQERSIETYQETLKSLQGVIEHLSGLVNGLLNLAWVSSDKQVINFERLRIDEVIFATRDEVLKKNPTYKVVIEFDDSFTDDDAHLQVWGNEQYLKIAFLNLFENGCKYAEKKWVRVLIVPLAKEIKILTIDHGVGIKGIDLPHIFEPFYRSEDAKNKTGYGIGLSLVQKIIQVHSGKVEANSSLGVGSIFTVTLPIDL